MLLVAWVWPLYSLIYNRLYPSYASALGVAYSFWLGCILHFLMISLWIALRRSRLQKLEWAIMLASFCVLVVLAVVSDGGALSKVSP